MAANEEIIVKGVVGGVVGAIFCHDDTHSWDEIGTVGSTKVSRCAKCTSVRVYYEEPAPPPTHVVP